MKQLFLIGFFSLILVSCNNETLQVNKKNNQSKVTSKGFEIKGSVENFYPAKVYLNKIIENSIYSIDSSEIIDNHFTFKGIVEYPERFAITFENYSSIALLIIENTTFDVIISSEAIDSPLIKGSKLNSELYDYKVASKNIFKKIDYLFPQFQKARLENDAQKLEEIEIEMKKIENEFTKFSYNFIAQYRTSFIAPMILGDQLKSSNIDTLLIKKTYQLLAPEVKNSPDAEIIASFLNLH